MVSPESYSTNRLSIVNELVMLYTLPNTLLLNVGSEANAIEPAGLYAEVNAESIADFTAIPDIPSVLVPLYVSLIVGIVGKSTISSTECKCSSSAAPISAGV